MNEYQKQANDFLALHGLTFKASFVEYGLYFDGDKEARNIYRLTLTRKATRRSYSTKFGASINMTLHNEEPTAYDLLACITKSDPGTFEDFCSEYGYDVDSRSAERTYKLVRRDWQKVRAFFSDGELRGLWDIS